MQTTIIGTPPAPVRAPKPAADLAMVAVLTALVIGLYAVFGHFDSWQLGREPMDAYYNLLTRGFASGHTYLPTPPPDGLLRLANPYDPKANGDYRAEIHDLSLYRGKLYLYFGPTPALLCFAPFHALTGRFLAHRDAVILFCSLALIVNVALWRELCRHLTGQAHPLAVIAGTLTLGLVGVPVLLGRADVWEVPIACGMFLLAVVLFAVWRAMRPGSRPIRWLLLASIAYGLALGSRPSLLFGAAALLVPVIVQWRRTQTPTRKASLLLAAFGPLLVCGLALLAYNAARFDHPFEFGQRYQLAADMTPTTQLFGVENAWLNLRTYLLAAVSWTPWFPFVVHGKIADPGDGRLALDGTFGVLVYLPVLWTSVAAIVTRRLSRPPLGDFVIAAGLIWVGVFGVLCAFAGACDRYEVEFLGPWLWLTLVGALMLDAELRPTPLAQRVGRCAWTLLLAASIGFSALAGFRQSVEAESIDGGIALNGRAYEVAAKHYNAALALDPYDAGANYGYGMALAYQGRLSAATPYLARAVRSDPGRPGYRSSYGEALAMLGYVPAGKAELLRALALDPQLAPAHQGLGRVLLRTKEFDAAISQLETAKRLAPHLPGIDADLRRARQSQGQRSAN